MMIMCSVHRTIEMVLTSICTKTVVLLMVSAQVMFAPIFGAKILFLPTNFNSHVSFFSRLAADLAQLGHKTRVLAPSNARVPHFIGEIESGVNFNYTTYPVDGEEPYTNSQHLSEASMRFAASSSPWEKFSAWSGIVKNLVNHFESDCARLLDNDHVMKQVRDEGYQFAVMDMLMVQCYYAIPYSLGIHYATLSIPVRTWTYRVPRFPSFAPSLRFAFSDRMSFVERLTTFIFDQLMSLQIQNKTTTYVDRLAPGRPPVNAIQLMQRVQFKYSFFQYSNC